MKKIVTFLVMLTFMSTAAYSVPVPKEKPDIPAILKKREEEGKKLTQHIDLFKSIMAKKAKEEEAKKKAKLQKKEPLNIEIGKFTKKEFAGGGFIEINTHKVTVKEKLDYAYEALSLGYDEVAINTYKDILKLEPENKLAMFGLATSYHNNKQYKQAMEMYEKILHKHPDYKEAFNNFVLLLSQEHPSKAIVELKKLEKSHPNFAPILAQIGVINHKIGNNQQAVKYLAKALRIEPNNVVYRYNLAVALDNLGDKDSARKLYRQVLLVKQKGGRIPATEEEIFERLKQLN